MRLAVLRDFLSEQCEEVCLALFQCLLVRDPNSADPAHALALDCLIFGLSDPALLPPRRRAALRARATTGYPLVARLLGADEQDDDDQELAAERPLRPRDRALTLGERKALARGHQRPVLEHLLRDPHPQVIAILLANPRVTERDVLAIASRRPAAPAALGAVFASARFRSRYPVRKALAANPHTPAHLALRVVSTLRTNDLAELATDGTLEEVVRDFARALLELRR